MTTEHNNFFNDKERPLGFIANGLTIFDERDSNLLGLTSPQHVDTLVQVSWERMEWVDKCRKVVQEYDDAHSNDDYVNNSDALEKQDHRRRKLSEFSRDVERLNYIFESVVTVSLHLWMASYGEEG